MQYAVLAGHPETVASFLNPDLTNKSWVVHLNCTLMARGNRRVAGAETLIPGGFGGFLAGNGVVFLRKVRWISFRR